MTVRKRGLPLRWRLMLLVVVAVVPLLIFVLGYQYSEYSADVAATATHMEVLARSSSQLIEEELQARVLAMQTLATSRSLAENDLTAFRKRAASLAAEQFGGANLLLFQPNGQGVLNLRVPPDQPLPVRSNLESIHQVLTTGAPAVSNLFTGARSGRTIVSIDVPVKNGDGKIAYVLAMNPRLDIFSEIIQRQRLPEHWLSVVLDRNGITIARYPNGERLVGTSASPGLLQVLQAQHEGYAQNNSREGIPLITGFSQGERFGWTVAIGVPQKELIQPVISGALRTLGAGAGMLIVGLALAAYAARRIAGPIGSLRRLAIASTAQELPQPPLTGLPEVDEVASALHSAQEEQRAGRQALRVSEERFRRVVEATPTAIIMIGAEGTIEMVNAQAETIFGYPRAELLGQPIEMLVPERYRSAHPDLRNAFLADPQARLMGAGRDLNAVRKDGSEFPVEIGLSPLETADGRKVLASIINITQRRQAERVHGYFAAIVDSSADAIIAKDLDSVVTSWNKAAEAIFGYSASEMIGQPILRLLPVDRHDEEDVILGRIRRGERIEHFETVRVRKDGVELPVSLTISPILGPNGEIVGASKIARDITERRHIEENLRASEEQLKHAQRLAQMGSFVADLDTGEQTWSDETYRIFGLTRETFVPNTETFRQRIHPEDQALLPEAREAALRTGKAASLEYRITLPDGSIRQVRQETEIVLDAAGNPRFFAGTVQDVTERRRTEEQLRQAQKMEAIGNLTGGMAHDFNNLLGIIVGNLSLAREQVGNNADLDEMVGEALDAAWRGADLTRRLLAFARRQPLRPAQIEVNDLVGNTVRLLRRLLGEDIEVELNLGADLRPVVVDAAQLEASLTNLATNARDAMPRGGRLIIETANRRLDIDYAATHADVTPGEFVMIQVSDTGTGMSPEVMSQVFEPFFTTKETGKGTGLGLSMVFGFLKQSGGHVNVYSELGVGTTFRLYLPRATVEGEAYERGKAGGVARGTGEVVLVVEDNLAMRRVALRQLRDLGYRVLECDRAAAALDILQREAVDLLFTDIVMPGGLDGIELARMAHERWPALKIILTSGFPQARVDGNGELLGSLFLLSKPYHREELASALRAAIDG
jgi:PAS domain S-box-containing protein